jgi:hypothetical protein
MQDDVVFFGNRHGKGAHDGAWVVIKCFIHYDNRMLMAPNYKVPFTQ